jgi:hypothetical protein
MTPRKKATLKSVALSKPDIINLTLDREVARARLRELTSTDECCGTCKHFRPHLKLNEHTIEGVCTLKNSKKIKSYNICTYHLIISA